ncbi:family 20 glycosylhydrolase [Zobellia alginiliquefaciens]|uniref:family 20 glycosylhydrolase n=1 Tax=Zobellia alginiliquefaciens TaxID=3032586 RepID=UPI0023E40215|nr:family 20 glycosylhydrolase [Zobellia alginiliquefaciens]
MKKKILFLAIAVTVVLTACTSPNPSFNKEDIALLPKPASMELGEGSFKIFADTKLVSTDDSQTKAVALLAELLDRASDFSLETTAAADQNSIVFTTVEGLEKGGYTLDVNADKVIIGASDENGFFNAVATLRQLLPVTIESADTKQNEWFVPAVSIKDQPRFQWRGMHMDFSRHFFKMEEVKSFLDYMALYKMNTYHMHLTDDQGWRMEIKKYPLLTEKGAWRIPNNQDSICNTRAVENELYKIDESNFKEVDGERKYGGFFTQEEIKEIIAYAGERNITVIPEIDMPGHFKSAIDNYPYLSCNEDSGWDTVFTYPACLGKETTYEFMKNILSEVVEIFPYEYIHIGGDEVNIKSWEKCPHCQKAIKENDLADEHELQSHFNRDIEKFLHSKGKKLMGWDEIVEGGLTKEATIMWWRGWRPDALKKAAENGNDVVITTTDAYYFDYLNEGNPLERIYGYEPVPESFTKEQSENVMGIQANLWSEWIPNFKRLQYQAFPRMLAVAENGWAPKEGKDFATFNTRVEKQYDRLDVLGVHYYIPAVKGLDREIAIVDSTSVLLELAYPLEGVEIFYTKDGSIPTRNSLKYEKPFTVKDTMTIKARAYRDDIFNDIKTAKVVKTEYVDAATANIKEKGLMCYIVKGKFKEVDDIKAWTNAKWEKVDSVDIADFKGEKNFNLVYTGYFYADKDDIYEFETRSDGGDYLYVSDKLVVDNSGWHGPRKRFGKIALRKGWHPIILKYRPSDNQRVIEVKYAPQGETLLPLDIGVTGY